MNESDLERIMSHPRTKELINTTANTAFIDEKTGNTRIYSSQALAMIHPFSRKYRRKAQRLHEKNLQKTQRKQEKRND
jgi:hypothetical protein|tara:strand:- start:181 stop:414 length:234 start_codon:yes stop_codon:yes gene_type:complete